MIDLTCSMPPMGKLIGWFNECDFRINNINPNSRAITEQFQKFTERYHFSTFHYSLRGETYTDDVINRAKVEMVAHMKRTIMIALLWNNEHFTLSSPFNGSTVVLKGLRARGILEIEPSDIIIYSTNDLKRNPIFSHDSNILGNVLSLNTYAKWLYKK